MYKHVSRNTPHIMHIPNGADRITQHDLGANAPPKPAEIRRVAKITEWVWGVNEGRE